METEKKNSFFGKKKKSQETKCKECNDINFILDKNKKICTNCGLEDVLYENMEMGYKDIDHININKTYTYEKICHFKDIYKIYYFNAALTNKLYHEVQHNLI